jgi:hypothetical protein
MRLKRDERYFDLLRSRAAKAEASRLEVHRTAQARDGSQEKRDAWLKAVKTFRADVDAAYPPGFWDSMGRDWERLNEGNPAAVEQAIVFLEADLWFFRSGYIKEKVVRGLNRVSLSDRQKVRLRHVVLDVVDGRERREFRRYCRLALKVDVPELRTALAERLASPEPRVRHHAEWVLAVLESRPVRQEFRDAQERWYRSARARYEALSEKERGRVLPPGVPRHLDFYWSRVRKLRTR